MQYNMLMANTSQFMLHYFVSTLITVAVQKFKGQVARKNDIG